MYMEMAEEEDKKLAGESWKAGTDGTLVFTGLFSASVASLISVSIQDIRPDRQDTSNFYLANIYQAVADQNRSHIFISLRVQLWKIYFIQRFSRAVLDDYSGCFRE